MKFKKNIKDKPSLYGFHAVRAAWLNPERVVQMLYLTDQAQKGFEETFQKARKNGLRRPPPTIIDKNKMDKMLQRGAVHQGVVLLCEHLEESDTQDFIISAHGRNKTVLAVLDQVTDPHNIGAILRSASAFGISGIIMQKKHAPTLDGVLAKTACGAVDHIPVAQATNLTRAIKEFQDEGFYVLGLDERGERDISQITRIRQYNKIDNEHLLGKCDPPDNSTKIIIVLGSEGDGIRRLIKETCDDLVRLPTQGEIASLNVSNAAAVTFYALMHK